MLENNFITIVEASKLLSISKSEIYKMVSEKTIPHYKISHKILRFKVNELEEWIDLFKQTASNNLSLKLISNFYDKLS